MTASDLIRELTDLIAKHGDLPVLWDGTEEDIEGVEYNHDEGEVYLCHN